MQTSYGVYYQQLFDLLNANPFVVLGKAVKAQTVPPGYVVYHVDLPDFDGKSVKGDWIVLNYPNVVDAFNIRVGVLKTIDPAMPFFHGLPGTPESGIK